MNWTKHSQFVEEVDEGVVGFSAGDEVYGYAGGVRGLGGTLTEGNEYHEGDRAVWTMSYIRR